MNVSEELLRATVEDLLAEHCTTERVAAAPGTAGTPPCGRRWRSTGLTLAGSPEEAGGSGGDLAAAADIAVAAGAAGAPVPLAETLAAGMVLARAGLDIPAGPLTLAVAAGRDGPLRRVPYGRLATTVAIGAGPGGRGGRTAAPRAAANGWLWSAGRPGCQAAGTWPASRGTRWSRVRRPRPVRCRRVRRITPGACCACSGRC